MTRWEQYLEAQQPTFVETLLDFLRIPSISALPDHADDVQQAAVWVADRLQASGIEHVEIMPTEGHPVVYGDWLHAPNQPTILIYGHFDVQPADPYELWTHPPFEPVIKDNNVYARGATDDKGNMLAPILAIEALLKTDGKLPINVKFFFEGQEEIGSPHIPPFLAANRDKFACDVVFSADGGQWSETEPNLTVGLKGLVALQIDVKGAKTDLHSGMYGGAVQNPLHALTRIIDSMRRPDGKILVDGFYDEVVELSADDKAKIAAAPFDETTYKADLGLDALFGEPGYSTRERAWARPTLELNGMWGGFQGEGVKTVLPNEAHAKISCRLVANQTPETIIHLITEHVKRHTPPGVTVTVTPELSQAAPYLMPADHDGNQAASKVLQQLYGRSPYYVRTGGSIPVCPLFLKELGVYTVNFAFGLDDENMHAPDEFYRLDSFEKAQKGYCMLLHELHQ